ncbi:ribonuclease T2-like isoform X2 [Oncorhynchus masou masou]|uniref:ribonuclease T2-like isoform X2 n=1 Tax=Oncorhynchus masou masou TaxID=90313 RepID=UPI003182F4D6
MKSLASVVLLCLGCRLTSSFVLEPPHMWSKLILTHHWPSTFCSMEHCHSKFDYWTLHGLWPDKGQECNSSLHFNETLIQDLLPEMQKWWPDLKIPESSRFWKYEWQKHGTCAAKAESLNSQHKYFGKALELYHKLDLDGVMKKCNIVPSETYYTEGKMQILGQIEICFNSDFQLDDCEHSETDTVNLNVKGAGFSVCDHATPVYYPPLKVYYPPLKGKLSV